MDLGKEESWASSIDAKCWLMGIELTMALTVSAI
jgi:hypothetical protein